MKQRVFHIGWSQASYTRQLVELYIDYMLRVYRIQSKNQLTVSRDYIKILKCMNKLCPRIP